MKEIIILFSTVLLGIAIGGFVINLQDSAGHINDQIKTEISELLVKKGE